jgi:hypothetical protein
VTTGGICRDLFGLGLQPHEGDDGNGSIRVIIRHITDIVPEAEPVLIEHGDGCDEA